MDQASQRIRDKLWDGILPNVAPKTTWGGYGSGRCCDGCDEPIGEKEAEHEVEIEDGRSFRFHVSCSSLWQILRQALPPGHSVGGLT